ncbi:MAG: hypothetical protein IKN84_01415 [Bacteroidales bacterium]|jgi:hypothetical protein|nr:hypothetical protein [Bacteroidales bacterium]
MTSQNTLEEELARIERAIANYEELDSDMENPEYVARGNGFCDSKYSEDFIEGQLEKLREERTALLEQLAKRNHEG